MKTTEGFLPKAPSCRGDAEFPGCPEEQRNDQESCSRMDSEGCPNGDEEDDRLRGTEQLHGAGEETPTIRWECYCQAPEEDSMINKLETVPASARTILLVDDNPKEKHVRAITLNTHGYDVESASNIEDAYRFSQTKHPDLVLLALSRDIDGESTLWERIKRANPRQRIAFLINNSLYLSPVFRMSDLVRKPGQDDYVERIGALFSRRQARWASRGSRSKSQEPTARRRS
jgi:CheY-like chemotaxis protein